MSMSDFFETLDIEERDVGLIFGKGASTIRALKEDTGARIFVEKNGVPSPRVIIRGTRMQVDNGLRKIRALIDAKRGTLNASGSKVSQARLRLSLVGLFRRLSDNERVGQVKVAAAPDENEFFFQQQQSKASTSMRSEASVSTRAPSSVLEEFSYLNSSLPVRTIAADPDFCQVWAQTGQPPLATTLLNLDPFALTVSDPKTGELSVTFYPNTYDCEQADLDLISKLRFLPVNVPVSPLLTPSVSKSSELSAVAPSPSDSENLNTAQDQDFSSPLEISAVSTLLGVSEEPLLPPPVSRSHRTSRTTPSRRRSATARVCSVSDATGTPVVQNAGSVDTDRLPGVSLEKVQVFSTQNQRGSPASFTVQSVTCDSGLARLLESGPVGRPKDGTSGYQVVDWGGLGLPTVSRSSESLGATDYGKFNASGSASLGVTSSGRGRGLELRLDSELLRHQHSSEEGSLDGRGASDVSGSLTPPPGLSSSRPFTPNNNVLVSKRDGPPPFAPPPPPVYLRGPPPFAPPPRALDEDEDRDFGFAALWKKPPEEEGSTTNPYTRWAAMHAELFGGFDSQWQEWMEVQDLQHGHGQLSLPQTPSNSPPGRKLENDFRRPPGLSTPPNDGSKMGLHVEGNSLSAWTALEQEGPVDFLVSPSTNIAGGNLNIQDEGRGADVNKSVTNYATTRDNSRSRFASELDAMDASFTTQQGGYRRRSVGDKGKGRSSSNVPEKVFSPFRRGSSKGSSRFEVPETTSDDIINSPISSRINPGLSRFQSPASPLPTLTSPGGYTYVVPPPPVFPTPQQVSMISALALDGLPHHVQTLARHTAGSRPSAGEVWTSPFPSPFEKSNISDFSPLADTPSTLLDEEAQNFFRMAAPVFCGGKEDEKSELSSSQAAYLASWGFSSGGRTDLKTLRADFDGHGSERDQSVQLRARKGEKVVVESEDNSGWSYCCAERDPKRKGWLPKNYLE